MLLGAFHCDGSLQLACQSDKLTVGDEISRRESAKPGQEIRFQRPRAKTTPCVREDERGKCMLRIKGTHHDTSAVIVNGGLGPPWTYGVAAEAYFTPHS